MKRVRNLLLTAVLILLTVGCCALAACNEEPTNYMGLNFGKYYLANSDDVYIEIKADHKAYLHNLDFSDFDPEECWGDTALWEVKQIAKEEVIDWMQGEKEYVYFIDDNTLSFVIKSDGNKYGWHFGIEFNYNGTNQLEFENDVYILRK